MSLKKNNTYFKENDGKIFYYDENGVKKEVPSTAFADLQDQIDNLSPLTYYGSKSVEEINNITDYIKNGTVYSITGTSGVIDAGDITVKQGDEVAWVSATSSWFTIGKDIDNSWKQWSEDNGSTGDENSIYIGSNNSADYQALVIGSNNNATQEAVTIGEDNIAETNTHIFGNDNKTKGPYNFIIGRDDNVSGAENYVVGKDNTLSGDTTNNNKILGNSNKISGTYTFNNVVVGDSNKIEDKMHDSYVLGNQNTLEDGGAGYSYVIGNSNTASDDVVMAGWENSSESGGFYKATIGWYNKVGNSNNVVIGGNNSATEKIGQNAVLVGNKNESSGGFAFGERNKVYAESYAYGYNNSAMDGSTTFGKNNSGNKGSYAIGDGSKVNYGGYSLGTNSALNGSHILGRGNFAANGGGMFGYNNLGGKGGYIVGDKNWIYYYDSTTSSYSAEKVEEFIDENGNFINGYKIPAQYAFGYQNNIYHGDGPSLGYAGTYFQIGYNNSILSYYRDQDTGIYYGAGLNNGPGAEYNIGRNNSAVNAGINLGASNIILTGDSSVGASINIGKNLVNRYGVLIGQSISSYGYGIGIGQSIQGVSNGDLILGMNVSNKAYRTSPNDNANGRLALVRDFIGEIGYGSTVIGQSITAFSGYDPKEGIGYGEGVSYDGLLIGQHIKGAARYGSVIIGQNGEGADDYEGRKVPVYAEYDSTVIGGYTKSYYQSACYRKPGISAGYNGFIIGQGQQMSATFNSLILGNESYAYQNGKVLGSHGYATNDSMVINYPSLYLHSQNVGVYTINGKPISGNIQVNYKPYKNRYNNVRYVNYYYDENNNLVMSANTSNVFSGEYLDDSLYYRNHYYLESNDKNYAVAVFNLDSYYSQDNIVTGSWINDGKDFQVDSTGTETAYKLTGWSGNPMILINDNGIRNFYVYNDLSDADKASMPHYFKIRKTFYGYYNNVLVTDKKYLYVFNIDTTLHKMESDVPSSLLCTSSEINSVLRLNYQTVYLYNDNTFSIGERQLITGYEWSGESARQLGYVNSSVYPSAIFSADPRQVVTNSTADQASLAIGPGNSAIGGSVAINGCYKWNHNIVNSADQYYYNTSSLNSTGGLIQTNNSAISNTNLINEPLNKASYNSIAIGIGTKGGWMNSATDYSLAIGSKVTAGWNSIAIGQTLSATDYSYALGTNAVTADNFSFGIGANGVSSNDFSYAIGHDGISADRHSFVFGTHGVYAENNGFAFGGQGITARNQGMAFGFYGVYAENIDQNGGGYSQGWGIAIGSNGVTSRNGGIAFGYNGVYSENRGCIAIGASGVNATGSPAFAIGSHGVEAYQGLSFGVKGKARNQSINLTMSNLNSYFASVAENVSINMITTEGCNNTTALNHSINIGTTRNGYSYSENGSITLMADANYDGYYSVTNKNQSIVLATKHYIGDGDYLYANNNSLIIGAGTDSITAENDSIAFGYGREQYTNTSYIYNGSVTIGHANTANGGVWMIGSKNRMGSTYTANDNTHPIEYTQTIVMGEGNTAYNYRPYLYAPASALSSDKYLSAGMIVDTYNRSDKGPHGWSQNEASVTRSMIVGNYNCLTGYNSFIFGLNNTAGMSIYNYDSENDKLSGDPNDDGFVYIFGLNNRAYRNYDMAIGYGAVAYGGENITIGTQYEYNDGVGIRLYNYPSAIGFRNISIRSNLTGSDNLAIISNILGTGVSSNLDYFLNTHDYYSTNFLRNQIFDSMPIINGNAYSINNNIFDFVKATTITPARYFDRNTLRNVISTNIRMSDGGSDNIYHNVLNSNIVSQKDHYNTYSNVISSTIDTSNAWCNSFSVYKNVTKMNLTVNSTAGSNLIYDVGGYFNDFDNGINLTASCFAKNIIMNAGIYGICNEYGGFCNNFIWKCYINPYNSTASGQSQISTYSDMISENMLIGTEAYNTVSESFSFGGLYGSNIPLTASGYSFDVPILRDCNRVYNFGDNKIIHGFDTFVVGVSNEISGAEKYNILGSNNFVMSRQKDTYGYNSDNFHDSVILGNCNAIAATDNNYIGYYNDRDFILGALNTIIVRGSSNTATQANGDLTIIGGKNHYAGLTGFMNAVIAGTNNGGAYNWMRSYDYGSILPVTDSNDGDANKLFQRYSAYAGSGMARNSIIGNHSVIGSNITDSTIIGGNNTIYQDDQTYNIKFNNINVIGSYNIGINGSHQFNVGFNNITSGHHSTAIGEELRANAFQTILGKYNTSAEGTTRTTMRWNSATNTVEQVENTGVLLAIGNGRLNLYEKFVKIRDNTSAYNWYDENNNLVDEKYITTDNYIQRSNAMIVSADGTVSARRFIESEPALTITGGDFVTVTEDTTNNKLVIDLESSLGQMLTELSGVLTAKPSTGRHILGVDGGTLTWLEVNQ